MTESYTSRTMRNDGVVVPGHGIRIAEWNHSVMLGPTIRMDTLHETVSSLLALAARYLSGTIIEVEHGVDAFLAQRHGYRPSRPAMDALLAELALPGNYVRNRGDLFKLIELDLKHRHPEIAVRFHEDFSSSRPAGSRGMQSLPSRSALDALCLAPRGWNGQRHDPSTARPLYWRASETSPCRASIGFTEPASASSRCRMEERSFS